MEQRFETVGGVARALGLSVDTVRRYVDRGLLRATRTEKGVRIFNVHDVATFIAARTPRPATPSVIAES